MTRSTATTNGRRDCFRFADFEVDAVEQELRKGGVKIHLEVQPLQVLLTLLQKPGKLVSRDELKQNLWADDTFVDFDNGVNQAISKIRRVLGDSASRPRFVETLPRRGYRFVGRVDPPESVQPAPDPRMQWKHPLRYAGVGLAGVFAGVLIYHYAFADPASPTSGTPSRRWSFTVSDLHFSALKRPLVTISPDGKHIAYVAGNSLWLRDLNEPESRRLEDTEGAGNFAWSPDGSHIALRTSDGIKRIAAADGNSATLWEGRSVNPIDWLVWNTDDNLVRYRHNGTMYEVSALGGLPRESTRTLESAVSEPRFPEIYPNFLGSRKGYKYRREITLRTSQAEERFLSKGWGPSYALGHILFASYGPPKGIWALPFSAETLQAGEPFPVEEGQAGDLSVARDGTLVFVVNPVEEDQLFLLNRRGDVLKTIGQPQQNIARPEFSPDGRRVAVTGEDYEKGPDIYLHDVDRPSTDRLTDTSGVDLQPVWSPDGKQIAFTSEGSREEPPYRRDLYAKTVDSDAQPRLLTRSSGRKFVCDWSEDGTHLLTTLEVNQNPLNLGYVEIKDDGPYEVKPFRTTPYREYHAQFSPDGRYVAFASDDMGRTEIYVCSFPDCMQKTRVSLKGGTFPRWAKRQGSLYYLEGKDRLMEVRIATQPELEVGTPRHLFASPYLHQQGARVKRHYDVSDDGQFVVVVQDGPSRITEDNPAVIHVWQKWNASFEGRELTPGP